MTKAEIEQRINSHVWYHELDLGNGLRSESKLPEREYHRKLWRFIEGQLDLINFEGKSVLDIGCWDGYWSFYAERRGAAEIVALDDFTQNWNNHLVFISQRSCLIQRSRLFQIASVYELEALVGDLIYYYFSVYIITCGIRSTPSPGPTLQQSWRVCGS